MCRSQISFPYSSDAIRRPLCHGNLRAFPRPPLLKGFMGLPLRRPFSVEKWHFPERRYRPTRSICLRDSGAVAPSASLDPERIEKTLPRDQRRLSFAAVQREVNWAGNTLSPTKHALEIVMFQHMTAMMLARGQCQDHPCQELCLDRPILSRRSDHQSVKERAKNHAEAFGRP
jgi:hypothetical protein